MFGIISFQSFLSEKADSWFRNIVKENRKQRDAIEMPKEDFLQMLLNLGKKLGTTAQRWEKSKLSFEGI